MKTKSMLMTPEQLRQKLDEIIGNLEDIFALADWLREEEHGSLIYNLDMAKHHADEAIASVDNHLLD